MRIIACRQEDVAVLDECLPSPSATSFHAQRFARQSAGASTYLVAWLVGRPAGVGEVRWNGCAAREVRGVIADCPEINGLHVVDVLQSRGIGTALIRRAEHLAVESGAPSIGLGVDELGNPRAAALYARLGYEPIVHYVDRWSYADEAGVDHVVEDPGVFLVKRFDPAVSGGWTDRASERPASDGSGRG